MAFVSMLSSCSNTDYVNAIPKQATAIISVDAAQMSGVGSTLVLKTLLKTTDLGKTGIDLSLKGNRFCYAQRVEHMVFVQIVDIFA